MLHWLHEEKHTAWLLLQTGQKSVIFSSIVLQRERWAEEYHVSDGTFGLKFCGHINQPAMLYVD